VQTLWQDLRYGFRILVKAPGFSTIAVLTLALGIGASTAIFSVVNTSLLRPLPFTNSSQLVDLWGRSSLFDFPNMGMSFPDVEDIRAESTAFADLATYAYSGATLIGTGAPQRLDGAKISAEIFPLLGMKPLYGRIFGPNEMELGQDREVILSYTLWQSRFGGPIPSAKSRASGEERARATRSLIQATTLSERETRRPHRSPVHWGLSILKSCLSDVENNSHCPRNPSFIFPVFL